VTRLQILMSLWLCGWLGCSLAYVVSAGFKAKLTGTRWQDHMRWSTIPLFAVTWPAVVVFYVWAKGRAGIGSPLGGFCGSDRKEEMQDSRVSDE
jgi:hypothetical protein